MPTTVRTILIVTIVSFLLQMSVGNNMISGFALWPLQSGFMATSHFMPWQLFTYAFLHADLMHLAFNMYGLWMFGRELELLLGSKVMFKLYFASVLSAALMQLLATNITGGSYPTVGASGGVFGMLLAYGMMFPKRTIMLLIPPIPMPAWVFVTLYAILELIFGVTGTQSGVAHFAHLGGMIGGYMVIRHWRRRRWG